MLVDGIVVIHVELHQRDDLTEIRDESAEHARLVHQPQHDLRAVARGQDFEEQPVRLGVGAQARIDPLQRLRQQAGRVGVDGEAVAVGEPEEAHDVDGIARQHVRRGKGQAIVLDREILGRQDPRARPDRPHEPVEHGAGLGLALLQRGADDRRQVADVLGDQEVIFHEALDGGEAAAGREAEPLGERALIIEAQALFGTPGDEVHVAAHPPQEFLAAAEQPKLRAGKQAGVDQVGGLAHAVDVFGDPEQGVEVAQPAFALLDVGLDDEARASGAGQPAVAFGELRGDEFRRRVLDDLGIEARQQRLEERRVADDEARLEHGGADRHVVAGLPEAFVERARRVPDLLAQVPQDVEDGLDDLLGPAAIFRRQQEQEVDVRARCQRPASIAADGDDRRRRGPGRPGMHVADDVIKDRPEEFVLDEGEVPGAGEAAAIGVERLGGERVAVGERLAQQGDDAAARGLGLFLPLRGGDRRREPRAIEQARGRDRQAAAARRRLGPDRDRDRHGTARVRVIGAARPAAPRRHPRRRSRGRGRRRAGSRECPSAR